jgi:DNA helicase-2/ATP-dependent DNA helicase PcrA
MALAEFGYEMTDEQALSMRSLGRPFAPARLRELFGEGIDYVAVRQRRKELMEVCLEQEGIQPKPGAVELLETLREKGIITAIATATDLERTHKYLKMAGLTGYFDEIISATQVEEGKPSPHIYRYACEKLGLLPEECIAVEDSPNGVMSAYRAGCKVVLVPDQTPCEEYLKDKLYACVDCLTELKELL